MKLLFLSFTIVIFSLLAGLCSARTLVIERDVGNLGIGAKCSHSVQCASGYCGRAHCHNKKPNGHWCYKDVGCLSGSCYQKSVCYTQGQGILANGAKCETSASCASDNCSRAHCADKQSNGAWCYKDANCISNNCSNGHCCDAASIVTSSTSSTQSWTTSTSETTSMTKGNSATLTHTTSTSATSATRTSSQSTTSPATPTIKCNLNTDIGSRKLTDTDQVAYYASPIGALNLIFPSGSSVLTSSLRDGESLLVELYECTSTYMGYKADLVFNGDSTYAYGQVRVPSLNNECITATSPGGSTTEFTHAPCSSADDASQIAQYFRLFYGDQGTQMDYLGGPFSQTNDLAGFNYGSTNDFDEDGIKQQVVKNNPLGASSLYVVD